jgi:hypothetical protein
MASDALAAWPLAGAAPVLFLMVCALSVIYFNQHLYFT